MKTVIRRTLLIVLSTAVLSAAGDAHALQGGEDPSLLPVLIDKRFGQDGRFMASAMFSTGLATKFVEHTGAMVMFGYNFTDMIGLEVGGVFFAGSESKIMEQVRMHFVSEEPALPDLYQMQWSAGANFMLIPLYGKISFASEVDPGYDLFLTAGGGAGGSRRLLRDGSFDQVVTPVFNFGLGLRFYLNRLIGIRLEMRDYFYPESDPGQSGLTFNLHFQAGVQFAFGGEE